METAEVDEGVGAQEEVGDDGGNGVEFSFRDPREKEDSFLGNLPGNRLAPSLTIGGFRTGPRGSVHLNLLICEMGPLFCETKGQCFVYCKRPALKGMESSGRYYGRTKDSGRHTFFVVTNDSKKYILQCDPRPMSFVI